MGSPPGPTGKSLQFVGWSLGFAPVEGSPRNGVAGRCEVRRVRLDRDIGIRLDGLQACCIAVSQLPLNTLLHCGIPAASGYLPQSIERVQHKQMTCTFMSDVRQLTLWRPATLRWPCAVLDVQH